MFQVRVVILGDVTNHKSVSNFITLGRIEYTSRRVGTELISLIIINVMNLPMAMQKQSMI